MKCPLCFCATAKKLNIHKGKYFLYCCPKCDLKFVYPAPNECELNEYYNQYFKKNAYKYLDKKLREYKIKTLWQTRLKLLKKFINLNEQSKLLEVGAGTGEWLETLEKNNFTNFIALEISNNQFYRLKTKYPNKIIYSSLKGYTTNIKFDVICLWDVLEHFQEININLNNLYQLLKPNGIIIFSVPNIDSLSFKIKREQWRYFIPPEHLLYFNKKSIEFLAKKYHFDLTYFKTHIQIQAFLQVNKKTNNKKINLKYYKAKLLLERIINLFCGQKGDIITFIFKKHSNANI